MKRLLALIVGLLLTLQGCAALLDGKYVGNEGKDSPFKPMPNKYEPPADPTTR